MSKIYIRDNNGEFVYNLYVLNENDCSKEEFHTLVTYYVADTKVGGEALGAILLSEISDENIQNMKKRLFKVLSHLKKKRKITAFADCKSFGSGNAETEYILNKYPWLLQDIDKANEKCEIKVYFVI